MGHNLNSKNNGFTRKKFLFTAAGILILIIAVFVAYQVLTSRTARETYLKAEGKNIKNYAQQIKSNYAGLMEEQKPYLENTYKSRLEISADIMSDDDRLFGVSGSKAIMDVLRKCKLILNYQNSPATSESLTNAGIVFEKAPLLDATMFTRNKQVGITVPILLPGKYFTINADNLDNLYDKLNIPVRPKRIVRNIDIANTLKFSDAEL
ncbi:MAG: hypothetical protein Q8920_13540, partial [Bacillota bacterium]|nr:hypothetical protein [Bacillota bacterium]